MLRVPGTAVFLNRGKETAPLAMRASVEHNHVLHEHVVILVDRDAAGAARAGRPSGSSIDDLGYTDDGITHVDRPLRLHGPSRTSRRVLRLIEQADIECPLEVDEASYFLSTIELRLGDAPGMSRWRKRLFLATVAHHRRRRRVLRPPARPHRDHGLAHRGLACRWLGAPVLRHHRQRGPGAMRG